MAIAYIGFGSNLGEKASNIRQAMDMLKKSEHLSVLSVSSLYETEPVGYENQDWFLNAAAGIETTLTPRDLLGLLKEIERAVGRKESVRWGPREIDLDLLLYDQLCFESPDITIPHPLMHQRKFVLAPLAEIAGDVLHPVLGKTVRTLLAQLRTQKVVRRIEKRTVICDPWSVIICN